MSHKILDNLVRMGDPISRYDEEINLAETLLKESEEIKKVLIDTFEFALKSFPEDDNPSRGDFKGVFVLTDTRIIFTCGKEHIIIPLDEIYAIDISQDKDTYFSTLHVKSQKIDMTKRQYKGNNDKLKKMISDAYAKIPSRSATLSAGTSAQSAADEKTAYTINTYAENMKLYCEKIKDYALKKMTEEVLATAKAIAENREHYAESRKALSKLTDYYLPTMEKMLKAYTSLDDNSVALKEADELRTQVADGIANLKAAFKKIYTEMNKPSMMDISSEISAMSSFMQLDGLLDKDGLNKE